jgi:protein-S-isoprenylcysteine O-methyltransferase Ste14
MTVGAILAVVYTIGWIPLYWIRAESLQAALIQYGQNEGIAAVSTSVAVSVHVTLSCLTLCFTNEPIPLWSAGLMILIYGAGLAYWVAARRLIAPLDVRRLPEEAPVELCRHGAFGLVRNPLYFGILICISAPLAAVPRLYLAATFIICFAALALRALQDEARMLAQLGEPYEDYCRNVKRLIPFVW